VHLDRGQLGPHPGELEVDVVPVHLLAVHERLDHPDRVLEAPDAHGLLVDVAACGVAAADAHDHAAVRDVVQRRVHARHDGRVARAGVRDHVAELDPLGGRGRERERRGRLLPQHVRVVGPAVLEAVLLAEHEQVDQALIWRVGEDGDAEAESHPRHHLIRGALSA
jgi:hypothetical protein